MTKIEALERLEAAELTPALYRTARRILDRVHDDNGYVRIDYPQARAICATESDETVRGHLARLSAAGLITVHRNAAIHIYWHGWHAEDDTDAETGKTARGRAEITQLRAVLPDAESEIEKPVYIVTTTNVVVDNYNNNCASSSSSDAPAAQIVGEPQQQQQQTQPETPAINPADWARVRATYEGNFGMFTSLLVDRVKDALRQHPADMVILAMDRAVSANRRRWDYVEGILRNWAVEGYGNAGTNKAVGYSGAQRRTGDAGAVAGGGPVGSARRQAEIAAAPAGLGEWLREQGLVPAGD